MSDKNDPAPKEEEELTNDDLQKVSGGFGFGVESTADKLKHGDDPYNYKVEGCQHVKPGK